MQSYTEIQPGQKLLDSLPAILNNDLTVMSQSAGTAFPTADLELGMPCYRSDEKKLYVLTDVATPTWTLYFDFNKTAVSKEYVDEQDALKAAISSPTLTGTPKSPTPAKYSNDTLIATAEFVQKSGLHFPQEDGILITADLGITIANGNKWHRFAAAATATMPALVDAKQGTTYAFVAHANSCIIAPNATDVIKTSFGDAANVTLNKGESVIIVANSDAWYAVAHGSGNEQPVFNNQLTVQGSAAGVGAQVWLNGDGVDTPNKGLRVTGGNLEIVNSGNTAVIGTVNDTGELVMAGDVKAFSDKRLKSNIRTIPDALMKVLNMRGVLYNKDGKPSTGVIAQEVQEVLPEVVDDSGEYMAVAYGNIVGVLIEAVKELNAKVRALESNQKS